MTTPVSFAFVVATLTLLAVPGPSVVFVVTTALSHGRAAGFWCLIGLEAGLTVHVILATVGVGALLAASGPALTVLRTAGVSYLMILGLRQIFAPVPVGGGTAAAHPVDRWALARDAFVVDLLNPQTLLLLLAFLPQFTSRQPAARARLDGRGRVVRSRPRRRLRHRLGRVVHERLRATFGGHAGVLAGRRDAAGRRW